MKIADQMKKIEELTKSTREKQSDIRVNEVFHIWNHLVQRYTIIYLTDMMELFAKDADLKAVLAVGKMTLGKHVTILEKEMMTYGIPLPLRPPKQAQSATHIEEINDRYIFRRVLRGIQSVLPTHTMGFIHSTSPKIRELFMSFLIEEMKVYDKFVEYGKVKGYLAFPPAYKSS